MTYRIEAQTPTVLDYINIRLAAGLSRKSEHAATVGLKNSLHSVVVFEVSEQSETPVGIGRIIGDGGCFFEVTDIAVLPEHQKNGLGELIMETLVAWLKLNAPETAYVSLMADHGTPNFYEKYGFTKAQEPKSCGMYMRITS